MGISQHGARVVVLMEWFQLWLVTFCGIVVQCVYIVYPEELWKFFCDQYSNGMPVSNEARVMLKRILIVYTILALFGLLYFIFLARILKNGVESKNRDQCTKWCRMQLILLILWIVLSMIQFVQGYLEMIHIVAVTVGTVYRVITVWVIKSFASDLVGKPDIECTIINFPSL